MVRGPVGGRPGHRRRRDRHLPGGPPHSRGQRHGPHHEHPPLAGGARADHGQDQAHRGRARHRGRNDPGAGHLEALPPLPGSTTALQGPRHADRARMEVGEMPRMRLAGRPRYRGVAADRRPRPDPPGHDHHRPGQCGNDRSRRRRQSGSPGCDYPLRFRAGPLQDRPDSPEKHSTPRAQATRGTLPAAPCRTWRPASGGTRHNGPARAAPRSQPGPGRDNDPPDSRPPPAQGARGGTRRRIPPPRPRHPATGTRSPAPHPRDN